jgi:pimeloyl-ACP methyl ester carboxylesterase
MDVQRGELSGEMTWYAVGSGPPLVVFPGMSRRSEPPTPMGSARAARSFGRLARLTGRTVVEINRPRGMAKTITMPELAAMHAAAIRERFSDPVDILGVSTGGAIALQLAVDHPKVVRTLVIACAAAWLGHEGREKLRRLGELERDGRSGAMILASVLFGPVLRVPMGLLMRLSEWRKDREDCSDMLATIHAECGFDVRPLLGDIRARTLIIGGERDYAFPPTLLRETAAGIPGATLVLYSRRGHIGAMLDPRFGRDVAAFLRGGDAQCSTAPPSGA